LKILVLSGPNHNFAASAAVIHEFLSAQPGLTVTLSEDKNVLASPDLNQFDVCVFGTGFTRSVAQPDGKTLRVAYSGVTPGHVVDNELCVDLWAGAHEGGLLTRAADADGVTVAMAGVGASRLSLGAGCELTAASRAETVAQAAAQGLATEFLTLHRVLTEAVQVRATAPDFSYAVELRV